jgi:hypothetical protein
MLDKVTANQAAKVASEDTLDRRGRGDAPALRQIGGSCKHHADGGLDGGGGDDLSVLALEAGAGDDVAVTQDIGVDKTGKELLTGKSAARRDVVSGGEGDEGPAVGGGEGDTVTGAERLESGDDGEDGRVAVGVGTQKGLVFE